MTDLFKLLKACFYVFAVGIVFYAGGYGWSVIFTSDEDKRENIADWNIGICILEVVLLIALIFFETPIAYTLLYILIAHFLLSAVGSLIYVIWWIGTLFSGD
jgi:hypothetical protein